MSEISPIKAKSATEKSFTVSDTALEVQARHFAQAREFGAKRPILATGAMLAVTVIGPFVVVGKTFAAKNIEAQRQELEKGMAIGTGTLKGLVTGIHDNILKRRTKSN